jgi:uncharacterized protein (DUF1501 family)
MTRRRHCDDYTRGALARQALALPGRGLPAVEPGMPLPAGTGLSRRRFLARAAGLALTVYGGARLDVAAFSEGVARAAGAPSGRVLVSVCLDGGIDALSVLSPAGDARFRRSRPGLGTVAEHGQPWGEAPHLRWHPAAAPLARLHAEGKLAVATTMGYPRHNQSHFTSRHYYEVGALDHRLRVGWLGRIVDALGSPDNPLQGLALDGHLAPALATASLPVAAIDGGAGYDLWAAGVWGELEAAMHAALPTLGDSDPATAMARGVAAQVNVLRSSFQPFQREDDTPRSGPVTYPDGGTEAFPRRLAALAEYLAAGLPIRIAALTAPGRYDTHDGQAEPLAGGLGLTAASLLAFQRDLEARGLDDRVVVHVWSEFGRRLDENGSGGTDHGAAGLGMVLGSRVRGTMLGDVPDLARLDGEGNLRSSIDFRSVYAALVEQWLGLDAAAIIPGVTSIPRPELIR